MLAVAVRASDADRIVFVGDGGRSKHDGVMSSGRLFSSSGKREGGRRAKRRAPASPRRRMRMLTTTNDRGTLGGEAGAAV